MWATVSEHLRELDGRGRYFRYQPPPGVYNHTPPGPHSSDAALIGEGLSRYVGAGGRQWQGLQGAWNMGY